MSGSQVTPFGKYELLDRIAAGGMAEIFKARYQPAPGVTKHVVIKKILPHYADNKAFIAMFTNEAKIAMRLSHGNIAQVFDFGEIDGDWFLAMEFVDGPPLSKVLKRAQAMGIPVLPPEIAVSITIDFLKGLHSAHTRLDDEGRPLGIVHRDVSPQNVLIGYEGEVKVVDFGIARARNAGSTDTQSEAVKGKYSYFSAEQAKGKELDARADVFASGIVLYELLTGQLPFQGKLMETLTKIVRGQFPAPRTLNPALSPTLERIVLKAMALERNDRYETAEVFALELSKYLTVHHRAFSATDVPMLMQLLFEEELVREGRPVKLPREFLEKALAWKTPSTPGDSESPTEAINIPEPAASTVAPARTDPPIETVELEAPSIALVQPGTPWQRVAALGVAALLIGITGYFAFQRLSRGTLELTSMPPGATVVLDGRELPERTPTTAPGLESGRTHLVELSLDGYRPWKAEVPLKRGQHLVIEQKLEASPPPLPPERPPEAPKPAPIYDTYQWPVEHLTVDLARHHLSLSQSAATSVPLDPTRKTRVWLGPASASDTAFYVVNPQGATLGTFSGTPFVVDGATQLFAFRLAGARAEARPHTLFTLSAAQRKPVLTPVGKPLELASAQQVTLSGLNVNNGYELSVRGKAAERLLVVTDMGVTAFPASAPLSVRQTTGLSVVAVSDQPDQQGQLIIDVKDLGPLRTKKRH